MTKVMLRTLIIIMASVPSMTVLGVDRLKTPGTNATKKAGVTEPAKNRLTIEKRKPINRTLAIGTAATNFAAVSISHVSTLISPEDKIIKDYIAKHQQLPGSPRLVTYRTTIKPGNVVKPGADMEVTSDMGVVPGAANREIFIKERISIYNNENKQKVLKTLVRAVNHKTRRGGSFNSRFTFRLPAGIPRGVYPIGTQVIINGKESKPNSNNMQVALRVDNSQVYTVVELRGTLSRYE